jgi:hypothetical protein
MFCRMSFKVFCIPIESFCEQLSLAHPTSTVGYIHYLFIYFKVPSIHFLHQRTPSICQTIVQILYEFSSSSSSSSSSSLVVYEFSSSSSSSWLVVVVVVQISS